VIRTTRLTGPLGKRGGLDWPWLERGLPSFTYTSFVVVCQPQFIVKSRQVIWADQAQVDPSGICSLLWRKPVRSLDFASEAAGPGRPELAMRTPTSRFGPEERLSAWERKRGSSRPGPRCEAHLEGAVAGIGAWRQSSAGVAGDPDSSGAYLVHA